APKQCFSLSTAIRLGVQILNAIREIHSIGFLHRDIKPSNFAMGRSTATMRKVFMLDFGLARQYLNAKGEIRSPRSAAGFRGTVRYAAVSAHKNKEMGRQDDLWSLFYMIAEFLQGQLPWRKIKDKDEVGRMKEDVDLNMLLEDCPGELHQFAAHLRLLSYPDLPDYELLESLLIQIIHKNSFSMDEPYDWELGYENLSGRGKANGNVSARMKSHTTAVIRDQRFEEKNRALETQAPITMGEDEDEQTNGQCPPIMHQGESAHDKHEKPKYKRHEFLNNKSLTISLNKRKKPPSPSTEGAVADELSGTNHRTAATIPSKWQASFDASGEGGYEGIDVKEPELTPIMNHPNTQAPSRSAEIISASRLLQEEPPAAKHFSPVTGRVSRVDKQQPPMHRTLSCGTSQPSGIISHFKGLINTFNNLGCGSRVSRGASVDETNRLAPDQDRDTSYKMRNSASTGLRISPAVTTTKISARVSAPPDDNDDEKEQRRQRRLRRRSVESNMRVPITCGGSPQDLQHPPPAPPQQSPARYGIVQRSVVHAPVDSVVKMRDNGEDEEFRIPLEDNNKPILFYKRKRYHQFLNFPRASSKS
ncbi:Protein kinase domain-containing protein, partial [Trichostrongylus colubriformis]